MIKSISNNMDIIYTSFNERSDRSIYIAKYFKSELTGRILDVGCDKAVLKKLLPNVDYIGIDISGTPDICINLEETERLPFNNAEFDTVLCSDVLEHLNNLHHIFNELVRVTKEYLIISLPNCWQVARRPIERGRGSFSHYGLPGEAPLDRHKWFFSLSDADDFLTYQARKHSLTIVSRHVTEKPRLKLVQLARRIRYYNKTNYLNRYSHTLWVVYKKGPT